MRSNLLKSVLSVFALAVAALFVGTLAMAAPTFSGGAAAGFGQVSWDTGNSGAGASGSAYNTQIEANLIASGKNESGSVDYYYRLRIRGTQGDPITKNESEGSFVSSVGTSCVTGDGSGCGSDGDAGHVQTARFRMGWNVSDAFRIEVGKLPGIGGTGLTDLQAVRAPGGFRHFNNNGGFFDVGAINFAFKTGGIKVGLALGSACDPSCTQHGDAKAKDSNGNSDVIRAQNTMLPYFQGTFGGIKVGFRAPQSSGTVASKASASTTTLKVEDEFKTSMTVIEASVPIGPAAIALELTNQTAKSPVTGSKDLKTSDVELAVTALNGLLVQYGTDEQDNGSTSPTYKKPKVTLITVSYVWDMGGGAKIGPEYSTVTSTSSSTTGKDAKGQLIRIIMYMNM